MGEQREEQYEKLGDVTMKRTKKDSLDARGGARLGDYEYLRSATETPREAEARRKHRRLPPLPRDAPPQLHHLRELRGGRGHRKELSPLDYSPEQMRREIARLERKKKPRMTIEARLRRAKMREQVTMQIGRGEIVELVAICDRLSGTQMVDVRWMRAAVRAVVDRVEDLIEDLAGVSRRGAVVGELRAICDQAKAVLDETKT